MSTIQNYSGHFTYVCKMDSEFSSIILPLCSEWYVVYKIRYKDDLKILIYKLSDI